jgi:hypothetical protein
VHIKQMFKNYCVHLSARYFWVWVHVHPLIMPLIFCKRAILTPSNKEGYHTGHKWTTFTTFLGFFTRRSIRHRIVCFKVITKSYNVATWWWKPRRVKTACNSQSIETSNAVLQPRGKGDEVLRGLEACSMVTATVMWTKNTMSVCLPVTFLLRG